MIRIVIALLAFAAPTFAGKYNKTLSIGDAAPEWKELEGTDGKKHSLADLSAKDVVVVAFTCNSCPVAAGYEDRLIAFAKAHAGAESKVGLVAINVNNVKEDLMPEMIKRAEKRKFPFPYLHDPSQDIAKKFGATTTPEFFVLTKERKIAYMGAMDEASPPREAGKAFLELSLKAALVGKEAETTETNPHGCRIRFAR